MLYEQHSPSAFYDTRIPEWDLSMGVIYTASSHLLIAIRNPSAEGKPEECIPLQLQLLFGKLQLFKNRKFINTKPLITSFQWDPQEAFKQHDAQVDKYV